MGIVSLSIDLSEVFTFHPEFSASSIFIFYVRKFNMIFNKAKTFLSGLQVRDGDEKEQKTRRYLRPLIYSQN